MLLAEQPHTGSQHLLLKAPGARIGAPEVIELRDLVGEVHEAEVVALVETRNEMTGVRKGRLELRCAGQIVEVVAGGKPGSKDLDRSCAECVGSVPVCGFVDVLGDGGDERVDEVGGAVGRRAPCTGER